MGFIFSHAFVRPVWLKSLVVILPFFCIAADVSSWYFTKLYYGFAWIVMIAGGVMAMSFAFMWITSMYQMWFYKPPKFVNGTTGKPMMASIADRPRMEWWSCFRPGTNG